MENKKYYELDKVQKYINCSLDEKDNSMSIYVYNYTRIIEAFIKDINDLKNKENNNGSMLEEFDIIDKFKKLVISEADRCIILNRSSSPISDTKNNKENTVSYNTVNAMKELNDKYGKYIDPDKFLYPFNNKENTTSNNTMDLNELINKFTADGKNCNKDIDINKEDNNVTKEKVNGPIKPKTIRSNEEYNTINNKVNLSSVYGISRKFSSLDDFNNNKEEDALNDFEFVAEAFSRLISKFNKGDI